MQGEEIREAGGQWAGLHLPFQEQAAAQLCSGLCPCISHCTSTTKTKLYMERALLTCARVWYVRTLIRPGLIHSPFLFKYSEES